MTYDFTMQEDIHLQQKIAPERDIFLVLMLVIILILESLALICLLDNWLPLAGILHGVSFLLMYGYAKLKARREKDARFAWIVVIALPLMGPVAPAGILFSLLWHFLSKEKSLTFHEWRESIFPTEHQSLAEIVYERITFGREQTSDNYSITYLMDVIKMGSDEKKREAIFKISRYYDPRLAPLLKIALDDPHNVIRVQAATAMTQLKNTFFSKALKLEKLRSEWPQNSILLLHLAEHYDDYAFSGLLDDAQEQENRQLALKYYQRFLEQETEDSKNIVEVHQLLGRLLLRMDRVQEACQQFEKLRADEHDSPDVSLWYSECLFKLGRYAELRKLAAENKDGALATDTTKYPDNVRGTIQLWAKAQEGTTTC